jgi:hypothetical protein
MALVYSLDGFVIGGEFGLEAVFQLDDFVFHRFFFFFENCFFFIRLAFQD